jgi:hypothetical protein
MAGLTKDLRKLVIALFVRIVICPASSERISQAAPVNFRPAPGRRAFVIGRYWLEAHHRHSQEIWRLKDSCLQRLCQFQRGVQASGWVGSEESFSWTCKHLVNGRKGEGRLVAR